MKTKFLFLFITISSISFSQENSTFNKVWNSTKNIYSSSKKNINKSGVKVKNVTKELLNDEIEKVYNLTSYFFSLNNSVVSSEMNLKIIFDEEFDIKSNTLLNGDLKSIEITKGNQQIIFKSLLTSSFKFKVKIQLPNYNFDGEGTIEYIGGSTLKLYTDRECLIFSLKGNRSLIERETNNFIYSGEQLKNKISDKIKFLTYNDDEIQEIWVSTHAELKSKNSTKVRHFNFENILDKNVKQLVVKTDNYVYLFKMDVGKIEIIKEIISVRRITRVGQANYFKDSPVEEITYNENYEFDTSEPEFKECDLDFKNDSFLWEVEAENYHVFEKYYYNEK